MIKLLNYYNSSCKWKKKKKTYLFEILKYYSPSSFSLHGCNVTAKGNVVSKVSYLSMQLQKTYINSFLQAGIWAPFIYKKSSQVFMTFASFHHHDTKTLSCLNIMSVSKVKPINEIELNY